MDTYYSTMIQVLVVLWLVVAVQIPWASRMFGALLTVTLERMVRSSNPRLLRAIVATAACILCFMLFVVLPSVYALSAIVVCIDNLTHGVGSGGWIATLHKMAATGYAPTPLGLPRTTPKPLVPVVNGSSRFDVPLINQSLLGLFYLAAFISLLRFVAELLKSQTSGVVKEAARMLSGASDPGE